MKKFFITSCILGISLLSFSGTLAHAAEPTSTDNTNIQDSTIGLEAPEGFTFQEPSLLNSRGFNHPTRSYNVKTNGKYSIPLTPIAKGVYLYTNVYFVGKSSYSYSFYNQGKSTINVQLKNISSHASYKSFDVKPGKIVNGTLSTKGNFYVQFYATTAYNFSASIQ